MRRSKMTAVGTFRTWRDVRHESAFGGKAENIYSDRVFRLLTLSGRQRGFLPDPPDYASLPAHAEEMIQ